MKVSVVPYDVEWPSLFEIEGVRIRSALGSLVLAVQHIGSTAVTGIHAKPIIDMLLVASDVQALDSEDVVMTHLGYQAMGEFGIRGRRYFRKDSLEGTRTHHLHAFQQGDPSIERHLAFRDYMNAHTAAAQSYASLKLRLTAAHSNDNDAYVRGKDAFIREHQAKALAWLAGTKLVARRRP